MVKTVLIQPITGGGGWRNRNVNMTERLMVSFWKGNEDEVWQTAVELKKVRKKQREQQQKRRAKRNRNGDKLTRATKESKIKRRSDRAKVLTNDGELNKALSMMVDRGVAPSTNDIIAQFKMKFPMRRKPVRWLKKQRINELRKLVERIAIYIDVDNANADIKQSASQSGGLNSASLRELKESIDSDFQAVQVQ